MFSIPNNGIIFRAIADNLLYAHSIGTMVEINDHLLIKSHFSDCCHALIALSRSIFFSNLKKSFNFYLYGKIVISASEYLLYFQGGTSASGVPYSAYVLLAFTEYKKFLDNTPTATQAHKQVIRFYMQIRTGNHK